MVTCEVCVEGIQGAVNAEAGGADRIELCAGLVEGGTTPSIGTIRSVVSALSIPTVVLVRPRGGDFLYSGHELTGLLRDIEAVRDSGAFGIATGALTKEGAVDTAAMKQIMEVAGPLSVTFHRAFDMTKDPRASLEELIGLEVDRVLTSGQERSVPEGLEMIRTLVGWARGRVIILPGGGITKENARATVATTGVKEIHFTAFSPSESPMAYRNTRPRMGGDRVLGEFERLYTDPEKVGEIRDAALSA